MLECKRNENRRKRRRKKCWLRKKNAAIYSQSHQYGSLHVISSSLHRELEESEQSESVTKKNIVQYKQSVHIDWAFTSLRIVCIELRFFSLFFLSSSVLERREEKKKRVRVSSSSIAAPSRFIG